MTQAGESSIRGLTKNPYVCVAAGSVAGGVARYLVALLFATAAGFPWATLFVNVTGSFIIGCYATLSGSEGRMPASVQQRLFVMTGFCGGYTTFSAFSLETLMLVRAGLVRTALTYIGVSVATWLLAVWLGHAMAVWLNRRNRS
jgi:fluoride exporter